MPSLESTIEIQKEHVNIFMNELKDLLKGDIYDIIIDFHTDRNILQRCFDLYEEITKACLTVSYFSYALDNDEDGERYENLAETVNKGHQKLWLMCKKENIGT